MYGIYYTDFNDELIVMHIICFLLYKRLSANVVDDLGAQTTVDEYITCCGTNIT